MDRKTTLIAVCGLILALFWAYRTGAENATLATRLKTSDSLVVALSQRQRAIDTVYRHDTVRLTQRVAQWRTLTHYDTVTMAVPPDTVRLIVATADSTIQQCVRVAQTCEQRVALRDSIISTLRAQRPILEDRRGSLKAKAVWGVLGLASGYIVGRRDR